MKNKWILVALIVPMVVVGSVMAGAAEPAAGDSFELTIRDHRFEPEELTIPAGTRVKLFVYNADKTPEEFESHDMKREKMIPGGAKVMIYIGPLAPGVYKFFGEFNAATAQGRIIVK